MKIVAGMGTIDDYEAFAEAGADELFTGFVPYEWQLEYEHKTPLNRREVSYSNVNIGSQSEMEILAEKKEKTGVPVTIAFNGLNYRPDQYPVIEKVIYECRNLGFKNMIISDLGLLVHILKSGLSSEIKIHISGEFGVMNSFLINRLKKLGADRIIYQRGISLENLRSMVDHNPDMEHEVFFLNENCHFTGAYCNSLHSDEMVPICRIPYTFNGGCSEEGYCEGVDGCGICFLKKLESAGVTHLKVVGRGDSADHMISSIKMAKQALLLNEMMGDEEEFADYVKNRLMNEKCSGRCYFR